MSLIRRTHSALSLAIALMVFIAPIQRAHAQQSTAETYHFSFEELGFREDRVAAGTAATLFYELPVPHSWQGVSPKINLHFSHSSLLIPDLSQMTVLYNDIPVADVRLTQENQQSGWLRPVIPENALRGDRHQLKIAFYQRMTAERCGDSGTEAGLWAVIHKDSSIDFQVEQKASIDLGWFPEPFSIYEQRAIAPVKLTVVLPAEPDENDLQAAGLVTAKLGQLIGMRMMDLSVIMGKTPTTGHVVVVGRNAAVNDLLDSRVKLPLPLNGNGFSTSIPIRPNYGVIQLASRSDGSGFLLISGMSDAGLLTAAQALASEESLALMSGDYTIVKETLGQQLPEQMAQAGDAQPQTSSDDATAASGVMEREAGDAEAQNLFTLQELSGTGDQRVEGVNVEEVNYCFRLPPNWSIGTDASLELNYAFSPNLWVDRSSLVVRLNSAIVANTKLAAEPLGGSHLQIPLPSDHFVDGYNCVRFLYTLRTEQAECVSVMGGELWAEIDSQSTIFLPHSESEVADWEPDMDQYPYPYNIDFDLANTSIVLPDYPTQEEMISALKLAARLGSEARRKSLKLTVKTANHWEQETDGDNNLILIGSPEQNTVASMLQSQQIELAEDNEITLRVRAEIATRQQSGSKLAVVELSNSPWTNGKAILQIISNSESALTKLTEVLTRNVNKEPLDGNIVTVTDDDLVRNVDTLNRATKLAVVEVTEKGVIATMPESISTIRWFLIGGMVVLGVIGVLLLALTMRERRMQKAPIAEMGD